MSTLWHVIRSKPNKETFLAAQLEFRNFEFYYPQLKAHPINRRCRTVIPYFPGYLFIKLDLEMNHPVEFKRMPGAIGLLNFGGEVAYVPENILHAIHNKVDEINKAGGEVIEALKKGDAVKIDCGPLEGYEAIFDSHLPGSERVKVLIVMLQNRNLQAEMPVAYVSRKKAVSFSR